MNGAKKRPIYQNEQRPSKRRSLSTTSRDTTTAVNSPLDPDLQYAPITTGSYHQATSREQVAIDTPTDSQLSGDNDSLARIRQFNNSHHQLGDPNENDTPNAGQTQDNAAIGSNEEQLNAFHISNGSSKHEMRAGSVQPLSLRRTLSQDGYTGNGTDEEKKGRKTANNNAANEKELRDLIEENACRSLESIARDVRSAERTQKAEKAKQLFAMRWLKQYCRQDTESVPRSRVYTYYATRCGTERVDTLNPASFGKLVRIIFPGIQTRRLGVRGESKYHYVSLTLIEDPPTAHGRPASANMSTGSGERGTPANQETSWQNSSRMVADSAAFPVNETAYNGPSMDTNTNFPSQGRLFAQPYASRLGAERCDASMYKQTMRFLQSDQSQLQGAPLHLPPLQQFLPPKTDADAANNLAALYRTHCTSLVDSVRYVKEKQFSKALASFNGTMTIPVQKLFQHRDVAPWIRECDRVMYQQIIRFVSQLALQVIPPLVFQMLKNISHTLTDQIQRHFGNHPEHLLRAKLELATIFSNLLQQMLRVNETAHAAANLLMNDELRAIMWQDWVRAVRPKRVVESSLSTSGHTEVYGILTAEMRHLLSPLPPADGVEYGTEFASTEVADPNKGDWLAQANPDADSIIERWTMFLKSIPARFPGCAARTLIDRINSVGNAALRDVTVSVAQSFGAWWTTKVWVDEMMLWLAEMGGFLDTPSPESSPTSHYEEFDTLLGHSTRRRSAEPEAVPRPDSGATLPRPSSANPALDFGNMPSLSPHIDGNRPSSGPPTATYKYSSPKVRDKDHAVDLDFHEEHDDSGIGLGLLDDGPQHVDAWQL